MAHSKKKKMTKKQTMAKAKKITKDYLRGLNKPKKKSTKKRKRTIRDIAGAAVSERESKRLRKMGYK